MVDDGGFLRFALPLFEQYFGVQAIAANVLTLESAASPAAIPRWRYAYAFEVSSSEPPDQEQLMIRLARVHPAASSSNCVRLQNWPGSCPREPSRVNKPPGQQVSVSRLR